MNVDMVNYSTMQMINTLFTYRTNDDLDNIDIANDCCRDYDKQKMMPVPYGLKLKKKKN